MSLRPTDDILPPASFMDHEDPWTQNSPLEHFNVAMIRVITSSANDFSAVADGCKHISAYFAFNQWDADSLQYRRHFDFRLVYMRENNIKDNSESKTAKWDGAFFAASHLM